MTFKKSAVIGLVVAAGLVVGVGASRADDLQGTWQVKDSAGKPFEIMLGADGKATGTQRPGMTGTWQQEGSGAVISWNTGWTTKIDKSGDHYTHMAWKTGQQPQDQPASTSDAQKVK